MENITIATASGKKISVNARKIEGAPPEGVGTVYVLLDAQGVQQPASFDSLEGRNREIGFFDCIELVGSTAYAFRYL
ncbi:hypothetical protein PQQ96_41680, partial [Paraburkholderia sediminicola]|uniref:hypothetical protein n=1 Tax=Paraburkholderia sediminicola TaxID=458836 RepID=UPI0038BAEE80